MHQKVIKFLRENHSNGAIIMLTLWIILAFSWIIYNRVNLPVGITTIPPPLYRPEAKWKVDYPQETKCIALCQKGVYHHHSLKQTQLGKCATV